MPDDVFLHPILNSTQEIPALPSDRPTNEPTPTPDPTQPLTPEAQIIAQTERIDGSIDEFASEMAKTERGRKALEIFRLTAKYDGDFRRAMKELGLPDDNLYTLQRSKTFQQVMNQYFPLDMLAKKNLELLNHPDWHAMNAALDRLHKLRGDFITKVEINHTSDQYRQMSDDDLRTVIEGEIVEDGSDSKTSSKD